MDRMRKGMSDGLMPPKFLLEKVITQAEGIAGSKAEDSPFARPLASMPKAFPESEQARIREAVTSAIRGSVLPAYAKFAKFVKEEYAPKGRTEPGMWSLPDGEARYAAAVKNSTTTDLTPEQIHQIGLAQVAAIEKQMLEVAKTLGFSDLATLNAAIEKNPKLHPKSREEILTIYRGYIDQMKPELPRLFGRLPKAGFEVAQVEAFREKEASGAQYNQPAKDGSRPGRIMVNTSEPTSRKTISMESTAYHEGVPGHHLQIAIAQELEDLPPIRQQSFYTAFVEGWALYSERLGKEVGFYKDPYSDYGRLQDEMLRAIRLVVDTGFHYKRWNRAQVVKFFHDHSAIDEVEVQSETDRYISWPGQALAYKIGQLKILELREKAQKTLGTRFDIRRFHDAVLGAGALPLDVLETRIDAWIARRRQGKSAEPRAVAWSAVDRGPASRRLGCGPLKGGRRWSLSRSLTRAGRRPLPPSVGHEGLNSRREGHEKLPVGCRASRRGKPASLSSGEMEEDETRSHPLCGRPLDPGFRGGLAVPAKKASPAATKGATVAEAKAFLDEAEARLLALATDAGRAAWVQSTYITDDTEILAARANQRLIDATVA